eukprot:1183328-Pyramimonas_sp.AAC.1
MEEVEGTGGGGGQRDDETGRMKRRVRREDGGRRGASPLICIGLAPLSLSLPPSLSHTPSDSYSAFLCSLLSSCVSAILHLLPDHLPACLRYG